MLSYRQASMSFVWVYACICICSHTCVYADVYFSKHAYIHVKEIHMRVVIECELAYMQVYMYACMWSCMQACMYTCRLMCKHVILYVGMH